MRLLGRSAIVFVVILSAWCPPHPALANPIEPVRTFNLRAQVGARETVAATVIGDDKFYFLITDRSPTGRSAILLETDSAGNEQRWQDLKVPAHALVKAGNLIGAIAPIPGGVRLLEPTAGEVRTTDLDGITANVTGAGSQLIRVLGTGDLVVHNVTGQDVGPPRKLPTAAALRTPEACATCGPDKTVARGAYVVFPLPSNHLALVHRSSGRFVMVNLDTSKIEASSVLDNDDIRRGRDMFGKHIPPAGTERPNPSNPSIFISGAAHSSGDMLVLIGPFTPAEGARVIRVNSRGTVVASVKCTYSHFDPKNGPPRFVGINGDELYLISSRGHVNVYSLAQR